MEEGKPSPRSTRTARLAFESFVFRGDVVDYMQRALDLADLAVGRTSPNPAVGAVVVAGGLIVGEGFTQPPGQAHAEIMALAAAGERARSAEIFVTLEPCCHYGRTPPCTIAIVEAGIHTVHAATVDPNPLVGGKGLDALRDAQIAVSVGSHEVEAVRLNAPFFHFIRTRRPFVTAKWAMTLDGKIATRTGSSRWITSTESRALVHRERDASDAIVVGIGTAIADDPALTVRLDGSGSHRSLRSAPPLRVVLDSQARLPPESRLVVENADRRSLLYASDRADPERIKQLRDTGLEVSVVAADDQARVDIDCVLKDLAARGAIRVLVEGGSELTGSLLDSRRIDRVLAFVAPKLVGGREAPSPAGRLGIELMSDALELVDCQIRQIGPDLLVEGQLSWQE